MIHAMVVFAGWLMLLGSAGLAWSSLRDRRRGEPVWRGSLLRAGALAVYAALALRGIVTGGTVFGAVAVWLIVGVVFAGLVLTRRERREAGVVG